MHQKNRLGFTLIEVIAVVVIVSILAGLIIPAIQNARIRQDYTQCLNNQRNVAVAILNFASTTNGHLPAQAYYPQRTTTDAAKPEIYEGHSWVLELVPYLDSNSIYDRWDFSKPWDNQSNSMLSDQYMGCLTCPLDQSAFSRKGGLSYALNCGVGDIDWQTVTGFRESDKIESGHHYLVEPCDWNGNGLLPPEDAEDQATNRDFLLFWPEFTVSRGMGPESRKSNRHSIGKIYDGSSNTILIGENINAGTRPDGTMSSWADPRFCANSLILPIKAEQVSPAVHAADGSLASIISSLWDPGINATLTAGEGRAPFPNSNHSGVSNFSFCDGSCRLLNQKIDMQVYARLVTPCGTRNREIPDFVPETPLVETSD